MTRARSYLGSVVALLLQHPEYEQAHNSVSQQVEDVT